MADGSRNHDADGKSVPAPLARMTAWLGSGDVLDVRRFEIMERMSGLFEARLVGVCDNPDVDFEAVIGQSMRCTAEGRQSRTWSGICADVHQIAVEESHLSTYEVTLVPALWLLTQRRNHRMFQQMSEVEIVLEVLGDRGISPALRLGGTYKKRKYRVQYGESDYAFVSRMLEDVGVSFYFDAESQLILDDSPQSNASRGPIAFRDHPTHADREHVTAVRVGRRIRPGAFTVRDHDHRRSPGYKLLASASSSGVEGGLERFEYAPGAFLVASDQGESTPFADDRGKFRADEGEGAALARRRLSAERAPAREVTFRTNTLDPAPGTVLSMLDHPKNELGPGKLLLVVGSTLTGELPGTSVHTCTAVSAEIPYHPPVATPRPRVQGVESATVVGPPGEEIHVDEFGRIRVHFHWDRESAMNERSSCWIPVSQPWGGAGYGNVSLPRIGQEVIVDFLSGDPDRPVVIGRVQTNLQKPPYKLPENKTQSGWKSNSTGGGGGYNELMFEDASGRELVRIQAEKDLHELVKNDEQRTIGHDRSHLVKHDDALTVDNDRTHEVQHDESVTIGHDRTRRVENDDMLSVGHDRTRIVENDESVTIGHDRTRLVRNDDELTVGNDRTMLVGMNERNTVGMSRSRMVGISETVQIGVDQRLNVGAEQIVLVGGVQTVSVGALQSVSVGAAQMITVGAAQSVSVGAAQTVSVGGLQTVSVGLSAAETVGGAKKITVGAAYDVGVAGAMSTTVGGDQKEDIKLTKTVTAGDRIEIACGKASLVLEKSGKVTISGTEIDLLSDGPIHVNGKLIALDTGAGATMTMEEAKTEIASKDLTARGSAGMLIESEGGDVLINGVMVKLNS